MFWKIYKSLCGHQPRFQGLSSVPAPLSVQEAGTWETLRMRCDCVQEILHQISDHFHLSHWLIKRARYKCMTATISSRNEILVCATPLDRGKIEILCSHFEDYDAQIDFTSEIWHAVVQFSCSGCFTARQERNVQWLQFELSLICGSFIHLS